MPEERKIQLKCPKCGERETVYSRKHEKWVCLNKGCGWSDK